MQPDPLHPSARDALTAAAAAGGPVVLAVITGIEGPAYRRVGSMMAFFGDGGHAGALSSGCIEADLALHARAAQADGTMRQVRYGTGSPFMDIRLPCGGGLDITLLPDPPPEVLARITALRAARQGFGILFSRDGALELTAPQPTGWTDAGFHLRVEPDLRFIVLGKGPEAAFFSGLVKASGYDHLLLSPEDQTLEIAEALGCQTRHITAPDLPPDLGVDTRTAIALFFHDHEWEPPILRDALATPAFYIGAQGSRKVSDARQHTLELMGIPPAARQRIRGSIGLIPSVRDPKVLAVSVLAEILAEAERRHAPSAAQPLP